MAVEERPRRKLLVHKASYNYKLLLLFLLIGPSRCTKVSYLARGNILKAVYFHPFLQEIAQEELLYKGI